MNKIIVLDDRFSSSPGVVVKDAEDVELLPCGCVLLHDENHNDLRCKTAKELRRAMQKLSYEFGDDPYLPAEALIQARAAYWRHFEKQPE